MTNEETKILKQMVQVEAELNVLLSTMKESETIADIENITEQCDRKCAELNLLAHKMINLRSSHAR
jgi:hypothetical protein